MTAAQASRLLTLCEEAGDPFDAYLSQSGASARIEALQRKAAAERAKSGSEGDPTHD